MQSPSPMQDDVGTAMPNAFRAFVAPKQDTEFSEAADFKACLATLREVPEGWGLLLYVPPEIAIAAALSQGVALATALDDWCASASGQLAAYRQYLAAYRQHPSYRERRRRIQVAQWPQTEEDFAKLAEAAPRAAQAVKAASPVSDKSASAFYSALAALECVRSHQVRSILKELQSRSIGVYGMLPAEAESHAALLAAWSEKEAEIARQAGLLKKSRETGTQLAEKIDQLGKSRDKDAGKLKDARKQVSRLEKNLASASKKIASLEEQISKAEATRNKMQDGRDWRDVLQETEEALIAEQGRVAALTEEIESQRAAFETLEKNFGLLKETHDESIEAEIRLVGRVEEAKAAKVAAEQRADALLPLKARVSELEKRNAEVAAQLNTAETGLAQEKSARAEAEEQVRALTPLKAAVSELEKRSADLAAQLKEANAGRAEADAQIAALTPLRAQVAELEKRKGALESSVAEQERRNASLEKTLAELQGEHAKSDALRDLLKTQVGELEDVLMDTDENGNRRHTLLKHQVEQLEFALRVSEAEREKARSLAERLRGSTSWRFTAPFRGVVGAFKR